jgi:subtilase family serine protease
LTLRKNDEDTSLQFSPLGAKHLGPAKPRPEAFGIPIQNFWSQGSSDMKQSSLLVVLCVLLVLTVLAPAQMRRAGGKVMVPDSSIARSTDLGKRAHTNIRLFVPAEQLQGARPLGAPFPGYAYETPASLSCVYKLVTKRVPGCIPDTATAVPTGGSRAIAVVVAYDAPTAATDLAAFSTQFGLAAPNFQKVYATGTQPVNDPGWELEASLDIEWAHAMAPKAKIILVEAASNSFDDLLFAVGVASQLVATEGGGEVSMSWGGSEFSSETSLDSSFSTANVVYIAAAGDELGTSWPSTSPNVVSAGGTTLRRDHATFKYIEEVTWDLAGGGISAYESRPAYQDSIASLVGNFRGTPDVAFTANPITGVWVLDSNQGGWQIVGGTSLAAPGMAGVMNAAGNFYGSSAAELSVIYTNALNGNAYHDIRWGYCGLYGGYTSARGWDVCDGVGSPFTLVGK